jgi:hypothetical protein
MGRVRTILLLVAICATSWGISSGAVETAPAPDDSPIREQLSPEGDIRVEYLSPPEGEDMHQIWLVDTKNPKERRALYDYQRSATVQFSPDEKWLIVNDQVSSGMAEVTLFERKETLRYSQSDLDLNEALWAFFYKQIDGKSGIKFGRAEGQYSLDHSYLSSELWSAGSDAILFSISGHAGGQLWARTWYCVYDLTKKEVTLDLGVLNRMSVGGQKLESDQATNRAGDTTSTASTAPVTTRPFPKDLYGPPSPASDPIRDARRK